MNTHKLFQIISSIKFLQIHTEFLVIIFRKKFLMNHTQFLHKKSTAEFHVNHTEVSRTFSNKILTTNSLDQYNPCEPPHTRPLSLDYRVTHRVHCGRDE